MKLTQIIRRYCKDKGLCPTKIAEAANMDPGNMSRLMNGKLRNGMRFHQMIRILKVCEVPASEVYNVEPE